MEDIIKLNKTFITLEDVINVSHSPFLKYLNTKKQDTTTIVNSKVTVYHKPVKVHHIDGRRRLLAT